MHKSHLATVIICLPLLIYLLVASSTGAMTIRTVTKAAVFLLALWPFLGTGKCLLAWLPASPQAATGSPGAHRPVQRVSLVSSLSLKCSDGMFGSTSVRASPCCRSTLRQPSRLRRGKAARALPEVSPFTILQTKAMGKVVSTALKCCLSKRD